MIKASFANRLMAVVAASAAWIGSASIAHAGQTVLLFNQKPSESFAIATNGSPTGVVNSSSQGVLEFVSNAAAGDMVSVASSGAALAPSIPMALAVTGDDFGCANAVWAANPEGDVTGYRLYYGNESVSGGPAIVYEDSTDVTLTNRNVCGLTAGTYYFAVRAFNSAGLLSDVSNEVSASISTGNAQPPLPPLSVDAIDDGNGCLNISWTPSSDPTVTGYIVDYGTQSVESGETNQYDTSVDVGSASQFEVCGLPASTYYVAVRAKNNIELTSSYSSEQTVQLSSTPVFVTSFVAVENNYSVLLRWDIWADESLDGIEVYRSENYAGAELTVPISGLLDPTTRSFVDRDIEPDAEYSYRIAVVASTGEHTYSSVFTIRTRELEFALEQNAPNPFNPATSISYILPERTPVRLDVFDVRGTHIATLQDQEVDAGRWSVWWNGTNGFGDSVATGTYFYRLRTNAGVFTRKMILVK